MAQSNQRRKFRLRSWFILAALPLMLWAAAFVLWLYWPELGGRVNAPAQNPAQQTPAARAARGNGRQPPRERLFEDERKDLEEVLRRRN